MDKITLLTTAILAFLLSIHADDCQAKTRHKAGLPYATYYNDRFQYSISYPAGVLYPQGEPLNGDGQVLLSKDKRAKVGVIGMNNALFHTMKDEMNEESGRGNNLYPTRVVTYWVLKKHWFVLSGYEDGKIFYEKVLFKDDQFKYFIIHYPKREKNYWDPIAARMARSFQG